MAHTRTSDVLNEQYPNGSTAYDEVMGSDAGAKSVRSCYEPIVNHFSNLTSDGMANREKRMAVELRDRGVTFHTDAGPEGATQDTISMDPFPRVVEQTEWDMHLKPGLTQRVRALNLFLNDIYGDGKILSDGVVPPELVLENDQFYRCLHDITPAGSVYTHVAGIDLIRDEEGTYRVLEDNLQIPSGVSYMLENRRLELETFPRLVNRAKLRSVDHYPDLLLRSLKSLIPGARHANNAVLLTPGPYNSAYFEHVYLSREMGVELVRGEDLHVRNGKVWMTLPEGERRVDIIYRRINTGFLDPAAFRSDSLLGVPGLIDAYRRGNVLIANAPGAGVADDKAIYRYVPDMISYYLKQDPILPNVRTFLGRNESEREYILEHAEELTIKRVDEAGGKGMLIGPRASGEEVDQYLEVFRRQPEKYIAQPTVQLSTHPCYVEDSDRFEPRHIDLRPFVLVGADGPSMVPGGLTRVAMERDSLVVNSSQGGGAKDTWVLS